ncbi:HEAT repeat domain-containing protein [Thermodesulfobacteriota bacterium]
MQRTLKSLLIPLIITVIAINGCCSIMYRAPIKEIPKETENDVRELIIQLYSYDPALRADAAKALGKIGKRAHHAVPFLIRKLDDNATYNDKVVMLKTSPPSVSGAVIMALGKIGDARAIEPLTAKLRSGGAFAANALIMFGKAAKDPLLSVLKGDNAEGKIAIVRSLSNLNDQWAIDILLTALKNDHFFVRLNAYSALARKNDTRFLTPLLFTLKDIPENFRKVHLEAIVKMKEKAVLPLIAFLKHDEMLIRAISARILGKIGDTRAVPELIAALQDEFFIVRLDSARALGNIHDKNAVEPLIEMLKDDFVAIRNASIYSLGQIADARAVTPLLEMIDFNSALVNNEKIAALRKIGEPAVSPLIKALNDSSTANRKNAWQIRENAAKALGRIGNELAIPALLSTLNDKDEKIQLSSIRALSDMKCKTCVTPLLKLMKDKRIEIKRAAIVALGNIGDEIVVKSLIEALKDKDEIVRENAIRALNTITDENYYDDYDKWIKWWQSK